MFGLVNGSSRLLWGYLMDKFGFKPLMSVIACIEIIVAGSFYFIVKYDILYYMCLNDSCMYWRTFFNFSSFI